MIQWYKKYQNMYCTRFENNHTILKEKKPYFFENKNKNNLSLLKM